ncbi:MAG: hypothetical protein FIA95_06870, partial [Gemmatimonadetes bacterium]|nr:hypothetical protein [Gemmatimonadota bacterium]
MNRCERWFEALVRLLPAEFRSRHGDDMRETFSGACAEQRARGRFAVAAFLVRTTLDLVGTGVRERLRRGPNRGGGNLFSWLDVKLGLRMLVKHPGLTLVSMFALAVGIPVGVAPT